MTLIITEFSQYGIVMVADSAVTTTVQLPSGQVRSQVLNGALKLQLIPQLNAGISIWGLGVVETVNGSIPTDLWIYDFIQRHIHINSLDDFANQLAYELQKAVGHIMEPMGLHLAGHVEQNGEMLPMVYHVRNCDGDYHHYDLHDFIPGLVFPPQRTQPGKFPMLRNGDFGPAIILEGVSRMGLAEIKRAINLEIPHPSLWGRLSYWAAWIKFVSDLYASSDLHRTIGGNIAALGITPDGQIIYQPSM